jgi:S1-C subfamily serine protease
MCAAGAALGAPASVPADPRRDAVVEAVQKVMPSVVNIATETVVQVRDPLDQFFQEFFNPYYRRRPPNTQYSVGSGVIIDEEGYVLTNFHVVNRASRVWVKLSDGREFECDKITETSSADIALVKIRAQPTDRFAAVKLAADDDLLLGETVLALGNPFGLGGSVSRGILSSASRRPPKENEPLDVLDWLQTDAAINPGNSGGPLINLRGELIGINVAMYREAQGIGFAVPVKRIAAALSDIYSPEGLESLWFGARVRPGSRPLQVRSVQPESPAGRAGLRAGDEILQVNGQAPRGFMDFIGQLRAVKDRGDLSLTIQRAAAGRKTITLRMAPEKSFFNAELIHRKTGALLQEIDAAMVRSLGVRVAGFMVMSVDRGSPAAAAELQRGMMITGLDGEEVTSLVQAAKIVYAKSKGDHLRLEVVVPRQRGVYLQTTVKLDL